MVNSDTSQQQQQQHPLKPIAGERSNVELLIGIQSKQPATASGASGMVSTKAVSKTSTQPPTVSNQPSGQKFTCCLNINFSASARHVSDYIVSKAVAIQAILLLGMLCAPGNLAVLYMKSQLDHTSGQSQNLSVLYPLFQDSSEHNHSHSESSSSCSLQGPFYYSSFPTRDDEILVHLNKNLYHLNNDAGMAQEVKFLQDILGALIENICKYVNNQDKFKPSEQKLILCVFREDDPSKHEIKTYLNQTLCLKANVTKKGEVDHHLMECIQDFISHEDSPDESEEVAMQPPAFVCHEKMNTYNKLVVKLQLWLDGIGIIIIGTFGLVGNVTTFFVLIRQESSSNFNKLLMGLSLVDSVLIAFFILDCALIGTFICKPLWYKLAFPYLFYPGKGIMVSSSIYMVVAISAERYKAICYPLQHRPACWQYAVFVIILSNLQNIPKFYEFHLINNSTDFSTTPIMQSEAYTTFVGWWDNVISKGIIPFIALIFFNLRIYWKIRASSNYRYRFVGSSKFVKRGSQIKSFQHPPTVSTTTLPTNTNPPPSVVSTNSNKDFCPFRINIVNCTKDYCCNCASPSHCSSQTSQNQSHHGELCKTSSSSQRSSSIRTKSVVSSTAISVATSPTSQATRRMSIEGGNRPSRRMPARETQSIPQSCSARTEKLHRFKSVGGMNTSSLSLDCKSFCPCKKCKGRLSKRSNQSYEGGSTRMKRQHSALWRAHQGTDQESASEISIPLSAQQGQQHSSQPFVTSARASHNSPKSPRAQLEQKGKMAVVSSDSSVVEVLESASDPTPLNRPNEQQPEEPDHNTDLIEVKQDLPSTPKQIKRAPSSLESRAQTPVSREDDGLYVRPSNSDDAKSLGCLTCENLSLGKCCLGAPYDIEDTQDTFPSNRRTIHRYESGQLQIRRRREKSTLILMSIVIIFLGCHLFRLSVLIYMATHHSITRAEHHSYCYARGLFHVPVILYIVYSISNLLLVVSSSINFVVYCLVEQSFRQEFFLTMSKILDLFSYMGRKVVTLWRLLTDI